MRRRTGSEEIAVRVYQSLSTLPALNFLDMSLAVAEMACALGAKTGLRGGDAIVLQVAEQIGIPLVTKDKEIKLKAPTDILVFEPSQVPF
jgi:predicted nucleic acid-binding protein